MVYHEPVAGPDLTLYAPVRDLTDTGDLARNPEAAGFPTGRPRKRKRMTVEHPALDLYSGYSLLLVRTALLRAEGFSPSAKLPTVDTAWDAARLLEHLQYADQEHLVTLSLNVKNQVNAIHEVAIGTAVGAAQTPDNILKVAFLTGARALIVAHNHPSGQPTPTRDDLDMTRALMASAGCIGLSLLDSLVIARDGWVSIRSVAEREGLRWQPGEDLGGLRPLRAAEVPWP